MIKCFRMFLDCILDLFFRIVRSMFLTQGEFCFFRSICLGRRNIFCGLYVRARAALQRALLFGPRCVWRHRRVWAAESRFRRCCDGSNQERVFTSRVALRVSAGARQVQICGAKETSLSSGGIPKLSMVRSQLYRRLR